MLTKLSLLSILLSPALAQFSLDAIRPDVAFDDDNDRFDVTDMMNKKMFREAPAMDDDDDEEEQDADMRRNFRGGDKLDILDILSRKNVDVFLTRKADGGFAYDDRMDSKEGGSVDDFERNLKQFKNIQENNRRNIEHLDYSRGYRKFRRNMKPDPVDEIMLQHAVPIIMEIDGYLKAPLK